MDLLWLFTSMYVGAWFVCKTPNASCISLDNLQVEGLQCQLTPNTETQHTIETLVGIITRGRVTHNVYQ